VFVTEDGAETDLDIGTTSGSSARTSPRRQPHCRRRLGPRPAQGRRASTSARPFRYPAHHERDQGADPLRREATATDVVISEIGGTVGDIESQPFLEAIRQFRREAGIENVSTCVTLVPIANAGELKTSRHSTR
jgi:CTP synthase